MYVDTVNDSHKISNAFNAMYVDAVYAKDIDSTQFLLITFLIFNQFSIWKKVWKAEAKSFSAIPSNAMYVDSVNASHKISNAFIAIYICQCSWYILYTIYTQ